MVSPAAGAVVPFTDRLGTIHGPVTMVVGTC